jgi:hypothetical protein
VSPPLDDRDKYRPKTPPAGIRAQTASPVVEMDDDPTGQHELGHIDEKQLAEARAKRPTDERMARLIAKLEARNDELTQKLLELVTVKATVNVKIDEKRSLADIEEDREDRKASRDFKIRLGALVLAGLTGLGAVVAALLHGCG